MAMNTKKAIIKATVEGQLVELMVKSRVDNIFLAEDESVTLASKLAEIISKVNEKQTADEVKALIDTEIGKLVNDAPEAYDTLKEIATYLEEHEDAYQALTTLVGNKVTKEDGKGLSTEDFTTALKEKLEGIKVEDLHKHDNKEALDKITDAKLTGYDNHLANNDIHVTQEDKALWGGKSKVVVSATQPADLSDVDLLIQIVD